MQHALLYCPSARDLMVCICAVCAKLVISSEILREGTQGRPEVAFQPLPAVLEVA